MQTVIRIENFRSLKSALFPVMSGLNVLVGPNGSGKSNILHALRFLSLIHTQGAAVAMGKAGGPHRNFRRGEKELSFAVTGRFDDCQFQGKKRKFNLRWNLTVSLTEKENLVQIAKENLAIFSIDGESGVDYVLKIEASRSPGGVLRTKLTMADDPQVPRRMFRSENSSTNALRKDEFFKVVKKELADFLEEMKKVPPDASFLAAVRWLHPSIGKMLVEMSSFDEFNIQPGVAREATDPLPLTRMSNDGMGVSEVINALELGQFHRLALQPRPYYVLAGTRAQYDFDYSYYSRISGFSRSSPLKKIVENLSAAVTSIDGIGTKIDPSTGRRFVVFRSGGYEFRPEEISDGTIKWLCLLVAIHIPSFLVVLLEEPENFMHPWMQQRFISLVREQCKQYGTSAIITTHSVTVLNSITPEELLVVRQVDGETLVSDVENKEEIEAVLRDTSFKLGDVWVSGGIGAVPGA